MEKFVYDRPNITDLNAVCYGDCSSGGIDTGNCNQSGSLARSQCNSNGVTATTGNCSQGGTAGQICNSNGTGAASRCVAGISGAPP
jgi:hypothetical protein